MAHAEIKASGFTNLFGAIEGWLSNLFRDEEEEEPMPEPTTPATPWDPSMIISSITGLASDSIVLKATGVVKDVYQWMSQEKNRSTLSLFAKNFWNYIFLKDLVSNLHLSIKSWLGVLIDKSMLVKFPDAIKRSYVLSKWLALLIDKKKRWGNAQMVNWLYFRFLVNPRTTIRMLTRGSKKAEGRGIVHSFTCSSSPSKPRKKLKTKPPALGHCFIDFERGSQVKWSLRNEIANFLLKGKTTTRR